MVGGEHLPLYLQGSGRASQEIAISGSFQQAFTGVSGFGDCIWDESSGGTVSALYFIHILAPVSILLPFSEEPKHPYFGHPSS